MKRALSLFLALMVAVTGLCSCGNSSDSTENTMGDMTGSSDETTTTTTTAATLSQSTADESTTTTTASAVDPEPEITTSEDAEITPSVPVFTEFEKIVEAQSGTYGENVKEASKREGASEKSYMNGFSADEKGRWEVKISLPSSQYYNVVIVIASDKGKAVTNSIVIDGEEYGDVETDKSGKFQAVGFDNIWLEEGEHTFSLGVRDGGIDFDYMVVSASDTVEKLDLTYKTQPTLVNKNANFKTKAVYSYLTSVYGKNILSGQYVTIGTTAETDAVYEVTGHYPAIRLGDMIAYTSESTFADDIRYAKEWSNNGGIVSYIWHWADPLGKEAYYSKDTDFDLSKAVASFTVSQSSYEELQKMYEEGKISGECLAIIRDIDIISEQFLTLQEQGVTILWRPLHEAGGGWFWWGRDAESYKWLWKLLYNRMTNYHGLNNLIWVWNGQNPDWYVGDAYCDMISADIYDEAGSSQLSAFLSLRRINANKPLALSECGRAPDVQSLANEKTMWSWFGIWSGAYVIDSYGEYSEEFITKDEMIKLYSNNIVISREELPDFYAMAEDLEEQSKLPPETQKPEQTVGGNTDNSVKAE